MPPLAFPAGKLSGAVRFTLLFHHGLVFRHDPACSGLLQSSGLSAGWRLL
jgi:hypothetical protein